RRGRRPQHRRAREDRGGRLPLSGRDRPRGPRAGAVVASGDDEFDADEWLARQFGQPPPAAEPSVPPRSGEGGTPGDPAEPAPPEPAPPGPAPTEPAPTEAAPAFPPLVEPPVAAPPPLVEPPFPVHPDIPTQAMDLSELEQEAEQPALPPEQPMFRSRR